MRLVLVGADYEENLGMCMIAAAAETAGHRVVVVPFDHAAGCAEAVAAILARRPDVVGLAAQFQHRGADYLALARELRHAGFRGHLTAGGQFATMAAAPLLAGRYGIDSVVLYEGENTIVELLDALAGQRALAEVPGLALPDGTGGSRRTAPRPLVPALDALPLAHRYRPHSRQLGIPFIPVSGSRGCWAACSFCSITSVLRDGREHGVAGRRLRLRSPEDVGLEMAMLAQAVGGSAVFCFHDDNFLLPRPADSLRRVAAIKQVLDEQGVARAALVGKCRPDTVTPELAAELARLGVVRMYVGIENASPDGAVHLHRGTDVATMGAALNAFRQAGIFVCYNLLVFEPGATLEDVACNLAFIRAHAGTPVNFCRAEPYLGTPLHRRLAAAGKLQGGFLGCDYRIADDRAELLFRICASAFREHNFAAAGVANRYMSLGYSAKLLEVFYGDNRGRQAVLMERAQEITCAITNETADLFEQALDLAARVELADHERISRQTALLGLRVAASDRVWHAAIDSLERDMASFVRGEARAQAKSANRVAKAAQKAAVAGWLALSSAGCDGCGKPLDPLPPPGYGSDAGKKDLSSSPERPMVLDPVPFPDTAPDVDEPDAAGPDLIHISDPLPPDAGPRDGRPDDRPGIDSMGIDVTRRDLPAEGPMIVDPPPPPSDARDGSPRDLRTGEPLDMVPRDTRAADEPPFIVDPVVEAREGLIVPDGMADTPRERWANVAPAKLKRSQDLPLCLCPEIRLAGEWQGGRVAARLDGAPGSFSTRWQAQGSVEGEGAQVLWTPSSDEDQLDVVVRTADGVAVTLLRLERVTGRKDA
jgi:radical SAM superfamily enzyme YgiQ (UPF0313 family)